MFLLDNQVLWGIGVLIAIMIISRWARVIRQGEGGVVLTLGKHTGNRTPGLTFIIPGIQRLLVASMKVAVMEIPEQDVICKDGVSIKVTAIVYYQIIDPGKALLGVENYRYSIEQLGQLVTRTVLGAHTLDEILSDQDKIKAAIGEHLEERTTGWGVKVSSVDLRSIDLAESMIRVMGQKAEAERGKAARIIAAEGERDAAEILAEAARILAAQPGAMQLRTLSTLQSIATEHNSTIVFPVEMIGQAQGVLAIAGKA
jgi:regulator of protease activity HflC (stomatin/prohibitin superfamily)